MSQELAAALISLKDRLEVIEGLVKENPGRTTPELFNDLDRLDGVLDKYQDLLDKEAVDMQKFYVHHSRHGWCVKEAKFFEQQGGLTEAWGQSWQPIMASSIEDARAKAAQTIVPLFEG